MVRPKTTTTKQASDEAWVSFPAGKLAEIDQVRGDYFSRSRFILLAVDKIIEEFRSGTLRIEKIPHGVEVGNQAS